MQLRDWLDREKPNGMTLQKAADAIGVKSPSTVQKHADGINEPDVVQMELYAALTGGEVTTQDWVDLHTGRAGVIRMPTPRRKRGALVGAAGTG